MSVSFSIAIFTILSCILFFSVLFELYRYIVGKQKSIQSPVLKYGSVAEDPLMQETIKRVRKAFKEQQMSIDARSMKSHGMECDIVSCCKDTCFIIEPDKIIATETVPLKTKVERTQELSRRM